MQDYLNRIERLNLRKKMMSGTKIDIGHTQISKRDDGVVLIEGSNRVYTAFDIKEIHQAIRKINNNEKVLLLIKADQYTSLDQGARQYLSSPESGLQSIAEAYVIRSLSQRLLLNFLIKVNGTPVPSKFFTSIFEAENWLNSFRSSEKKLETDAIERSSNP